MGETDNEREKSFQCMSREQQMFEASFQSEDNLKLVFL